jgi:hypothetical protein
MIKSRMMKWAGHVARMGAKRNAYRVLVGKSEGKEPLEDLDVGGRSIPKWILERLDGMVWTGLIWLRLGPEEGPFEHGNKALGSIKY